MLRSTRPEPLRAVGHRALLLEADSVGTGGYRGRTLPGAARPGENHAPLPPERHVEREADRERRLGEGVAGPQCHGERKGWREVRLQVVAISVWQGRLSAGVRGKRLRRPVADCDSGLRHCDRVHGLEYTRWAESAAPRGHRPRAGSGHRRQALVSDYPVNQELTIVDSLSSV